MRGQHDEGLLKNPISTACGVQKVCKHIKGPEIFGEMGILNSKVRNASAIAYEDCVLLRLTPDNIFDDIDNFVLSQLFHSFARRIWYANQRFRLLGIRNPLLKIYMQLKMLVTDQVTKEKLDDSVKEFEFTIGPDELKKMVGIYSSSAEVFEELQNDTNLVMGRQQIKVKDRQKLEAKYSILYKKSLMEKK
ncbi:MAG: cyclic nucleotide-binding domain-containing protein [Spirochaetota bacterium]